MKASDRLPDGGASIVLQCPNDEALADEYLDYDPDTEAMLEGDSRRINEVRVEKTTD